MRKAILSAILFGTQLHSFAQSTQTSFKGYFCNEEYKVYIRMDLTDSNIIVPGYEMFGELPGFLGKYNNNFYWLITSGKIISPTKAEIELINDYGSEDLKATVTVVNDSTYTLSQISGSPLKVPDNRKWMKLPKTIILKKK